MNDEHMIGEMEFDLSEVSYRRRETDRPQPLDYPTREAVNNFIGNQEQKSSAKLSLIQRILKFR
ncbi:MAG: hypothetical protein AAF353_14325 [Pseudomonadota bacterium]